MLRSFLVLALTLGISAMVNAADTWSTAVTKNGDRAIVYRFVSRFDRSVVRAEASNRVIVRWVYPSSDGMPSKTDREAIDEFEDIFVPLVESNGLSHMAMVSTGEGERLWLLYTKDVESFLGKIHKVKVGRPSVPMTVDVGQNEGWVLYERFINSVRK